ncbi:hypothetical protein CEXT_323571 [Caerostris extrusa]|uniref:Uncharacterized protein n=1 Tax=Caerostris extrusa TaxID=172846 RepID=A0AAV4SBR9_CAEEX|nr:hypothetical protein CEXT_323571 [Caerostris extrusa]
MSLRQLIIKHHVMRGTCESYLLFSFSVKGKNLCAMAVEIVSQGQGAGVVETKIKLMSRNRDILRLILSNKYLMQQQQTSDPQTPDLEDFLSLMSKVDPLTDQQSF